MKHLPWLLILLLILTLPLAASAEGALHYLTPEDPRPTLAQDGLLEVHLINVASADCILLRMGGLTFMIDSGRAGKLDRILEYLASIGVDSLDYAFASHPHDDHIGGYVGMVDVLPIQTFLMAPTYDDFKEQCYLDLKSGLARNNIPVEIVENESTLEFGSATLTFYQFQDPLTSENNRSMMVKLQYGDRTMLFAADVSNRGQRMLAEQYGELLSAEILKMPHHGLAVYRKELHAAVQPQLATFSNVRANIEDTVRTTESRGVDVLYTTKGTILLVTDQGPWQVWQMEE